MRQSLAVVSSFVFVCGTAVAGAQAPAPKGATIGFMHAIHASNNLDTTAAFYKEVFGASSPIRPFVNDGPRILTNSPQANLRVSMLPLPGQGFNFELTEFTNVEPRTTGQQASIVDPGAPHMKILVRDIEPVLAGVRKMGHAILTTGAKPISLKNDLGDVKAIFFRDPDGYIVEAIQVTPAADAPAGNIVGAIMGVTVRDMDADMKFWRDRMGFEPTGSKAFSTDPALVDLYGLPKGGSVRAMQAVVPGSKARIEFLEFKGMPRKEFSLRVTDPGASGMAIRVQKLDELVTQLKGDGIRVLSRNAEVVQWSATVRNIFLKDPNGINLELVWTDPNAPAPAAAPRPAAPSAAPSTR